MFQPAQPVDKVTESDISQQAFLLGGRILIYIANISF